jgi:sugar lactone lactonase YvrE
VRVRAADLNPQKPPIAQTFATGTEGANGIVFDRQGNLFVSGGRTGIVHRIGVNGGAAEAAVRIEPHARKLPDGKSEQAIVTNGLEIDSKGVLHVADTARGAIWKIPIGADGKGGKPTVLAQSPLLEGADGLAFDRSGKLWVTVNERNALVAVTADGKVQEIAKNASQGPLEFPAAIVFAGDTAYIANFDTPRRDNMDANGKTALDGVGSSIAQITP